MTHVLQRRLSSPSSASKNVPDGLVLLAPIPSNAKSVFSHDALSFLAMIHREFNRRRLELLHNRRLRQTRLDMGELPRFLEETSHIRNDNTWRAAKPAPGLIDRRVEITGPIDRKMVINALNAGAQTFMADFEDSTAPTWDNIALGVQNMHDAEEGELSRRCNT